MITHCTKCNIHWTALWKEDDHHAVEYCPECSTDAFLEESEDFVGYIKCPISGKITNAFTGKDLQQERLESMPVTKPKFRVIVGKPERETIEEREARELAGIEAYLTSGNKKDYHSTIKKVK